MMMIGCVAVALVLFHCGSFASVRPNIVVFVSDDLGWNDVGFHGSNEIPTPNIDALGYNGAIFQRHYALPGCTPSRASLLTGQYPIRLGYQGEPISAGEERSLKAGTQTLPAELKKLGYKTHLAGKWHLGFGRLNASALAFGYDTHYGYQNGFIGYFNHKINRLGLEGVDFFSDNIPLTNVSGVYATDLITDRALNIIEQHPIEEPLFLSVHHLAPHAGFDKNSEFKLEVEDEQATNRKYSYIKSPERRMLADVVERMDHSLGRIVEKLKDAGMLNNTIIVYINDNGGPTKGLYSTETSNFPLRGIKGLVYEGAVRVPAAIYYDKMANRGRIFNELFHMSDWVPTLYSAAGGDPNVFETMDGIDQWDNINLDENLSKRKELLVNIDEKLEMSSYIGYGGRYKIVKTPNFPYDNYTGSVGARRPNYMSTVATSLTNRAINPTGYRRTKRFEAIHLQSSLSTATMQIGTPPPCTDWCLFDLYKDPHEYFNVAKKYPHIVAELTERVNYYQTQMVPQLKQLSDPTSNPKYCHGYWFFWLEEKDACYFNRTDVNI